MVPSAGEKAGREGRQCVFSGDKFDSPVGQESGEEIQEFAGHLASRDHHCSMMPC